mmetsp:Transcript_12244/g.42690  ORF Transcript_12244/g.42690 Transcript_12244/m.42690 type:complete len:254 (+) Transcript_12244:4036-4797(+)
MLAEERRVPRRPQHRPHGRQVAPREDMAADEVRAAAVLHVVLVLVCDGLDDGLASRHQQLLDHSEVLPEVLVPHRLDHLDRYQPVKLPQQLGRQLAVVAEEDGDPVAHAPLLHLGRGVAELFLTDRDPRYPAPEALHRPDCETSPAAADLEDVMARVEFQLVEDQVQLVELGLVEGVLWAVEDAGGVHPGLVEEEPVHVVAKVIVLVDVLERTLHRVGPGHMRHRLHLSADPVEDPEALLQRVELFDVLREDV